jgi:uncharacterized protein (DUF433 family)
MLGKPVIRNTRIPVELLLRKRSEGVATADILDAYPLAYAADTISHEAVYGLISN